jgi:hypothetical protein
MVDAIKPNNLYKCEFFQKILTIYALHLKPNFFFKKSEKWCMFIASCIDYPNGEFFFSFSKEEIK